MANELQEIARRKRAIVALRVKRKKAGEAFTRAASRRIDSGRRWQPLVDAASKIALWRINRADKAIAEHEAAITLAWARYRRLDLE